MCGGSSGTSRTICIRATPSMSHRNFHLSEEGLVPNPIICDISPVRVGSNLRARGLTLSRLFGRRVHNLRESSQFHHLTFRLAEAPPPHVLSCANSRFPSLGRLSRYSILPHNTCSKLCSRRMPASTGSPRYTLAYFRIPGSSQADDNLGQPRSRRIRLHYLVSAIVECRQGTILKPRRRRINRHRVQRVQA